MRFKYNYYTIFSYKIEKDIRITKNTECIIIMKYYCSNSSFILNFSYQKSDIELCLFVKEGKKKTKNEPAKQLFVEFNW